MKKEMKMKREEDTFPKTKQNHIRFVLYIIHIEKIVENCAYSLNFYFPQNVQCRPHS